MKIKKTRYTKSTLPKKICANCNRPMTWRKAWAKTWDAVKYCSDRCRAEAKQKRKTQTSML